MGEDRLRRVTLSEQRPHKKTLKNGIYTAKGEENLHGIIYI